MDVNFQPLFVFLFILGRLGGLVVLAPLQGRSLPPRLRILLVVAFAVILTPLHLDWARLDGAPPFTGPAMFLIAMGREITLGLAHGLALLLLVSGLQLAGQLISQLSGLQMADVFDPELRASVPVLSRLLELLTLAVFLLLGGHRQVLAAVLDSFQWMPPGRAEVPRDLVLALADVAGHSFELGLRVASPVLAALLISTLILGLISRTLPQLNVLALGFGLNTLVMLGALFLSLGTITLVFQQYAGAALEQLQQTVAGIPRG